MLAISNGHFSQRKDVIAEPHPLEHGIDRDIHLEGVDDAAGSPFLEAPIEVLTAFLVAKA